MTQEKREEFNWTPPKGMKISWNILYYKPDSEEMCYFYPDRIPGLQLEEAIAYIESQNFYKAHIWGTCTKRRKPCNCTEQNGLISYPWEWVNTQWIKWRH